MADKKFILQGAAAITLSTFAVDSLIKSGDGDAALLYLYIVKNNGAVSCSDAETALGKSAAVLEQASKTLERLGLTAQTDMTAAGQVCPPDAETGRPLPNDALPDYTSEDIQRELSGSSVFSQLVKEVQQSLGKVLSSDDLIKLLGIHSGLGLPPDVILQLITFCTGEIRRKSGPGRVPTMRYIEKAAYTWEQEGIFSFEAAEKYIKELQQRRLLASEIKTVLQIKDRELSSSERKYVDGWIEMGFAPDAVAIAYDRTILQTGKLSWNYMDKIICSWYAKGLISAKDILQKDTKQKKSAAPAPDTDAAPTATDINRMKKFLEKLKEG